MLENLYFMHDYYGLFLSGLEMTLYISLLSALCGLIIGIFAGIARISQNPVCRYLSSFYVQVIRGVPLLVFLLYVYYGIGAFVDLSAFTAGVLALSLFCGSYVAEIIRGGIQALPKGQWEAAECLGLSYFQQMIFVILPQALRSTLPALAGQFISLIKDSSLVSTIAVVELTMASKNVMARTFHAFEVYTITAIIYLLLTYVLTKCVALLEKKLL